MFSMWVLGKRVVKEFFTTVEGSSPIEIHRCLRSIHGDASSVRCWASKRDSGDKPCSNWHSVAHKCGRSVLIMKQTLWKEFLNFVKEVPMTYVHFTVIVITVPEKKKIRRHYCHTTPHIQCIYIYGAHYQISHLVPLAY